LRKDLAINKEIPRGHSFCSSGQAREVPDLKISTFWTACNNAKVQTYLCLNFLSSKFGLHLVQSDRCSNFFTKL